MIQREQVDEAPASHAAAPSRTVADVKGLLVELARACKGLSFYAEGHPARADLVDRAWMAWRLEVQRGGALALQREPDGLRIDGVDQLLTPAAIDELEVALHDRDVERIELGEDATRESFTALLELLGQPPDTVSQRGGVAAALAQRCDRGISVNGATPTPEATATVASIGATSLGAGLLVSTRDLVHSDQGGETGLDGETEAVKLGLDDDPLLAPAGDAAGETLRRELVALDGTAEDEAYEQGALHVLEVALGALGEGRLDDGYRAVLVLADHAVGEGGRSARQARLAHETSQALCTGAALDEIIDRACASDVRRSVRASRVLLHLGETAAERVLTRITEAGSDDRMAQLRAILTALGDHARPGLERALAEGPPRVAASAARLCGDTQNPALVPALAIGLRRDDPTLLRAAVSALTLIGGPAAGDALMNELSRPDPAVVETCSQGLAVLGEDRFVLPLLAALDRAERRGDAEAAVQLVRALGRLGSERAVPRLASMLRRRRLLARGQRLDLQTRALETLAELPGREARRTVEWTARSGPRGLRARARSLLGRAHDDAPTGDEPHMLESNAADSPSAD